MGVGIREIEMLENLGEKKIYNRNFYYVKGVRLVRFFLIGIFRFVREEKINIG